MTHSMTTHTHPGRPFPFDDAACPICRGEVAPWPSAVAPCGCTPVTTCARHRAEKET